MDAAWRLVREPVTPRYKVREVAVLADVAPRTVDNTRKRHHVMHEEGLEITGSWARDRRPLPQDDTELDQLTETQRKAQIDTLIRTLRDALDRRKHPELTILRESEAVWEAVQGALGEQTTKAMLAWLHGGDDETADEWLELAAAGVMGDDEDDEETDF